MRVGSLPILALLFASSAIAQLPPDAALRSMKPANGLQVELFAAEPMLFNPTSIDIDPKGRVWVAEAVNYRRVNFGRPIVREEGDRIVVLTDKNADGQADESTVFYQGKELYGPLSVCVVPQPDGAYRVLVAQSPNILEFWDKDGDLKADGKPTVFLTGFKGFDHDHGVHGLSIGPDGKLYFTVGDEGVRNLQSKDGKGRKFTSNKDDIQGGTVWRVDLDGNNLELIAHNFRNNYEAAVDSFGEIWLSDNDDDGNQQTRICFVMPGGNYGYFPRGPGQSHWHEEQPGIVHKVLRTYFGSPTGMAFYEGTLLPKQYQGTILHTDAGPRELRSFTRIPKGAGYELTKELMLTSDDNWFRPSDVCVAPDGSVMVCDWYDPGVGGHGMGDTTRGRVYRVTPKGHQGYKVPELKLDTQEGVLAALGSPTLSTRALVASLSNDVSTNAIEDQAEMRDTSLLTIRAKLLSEELRPMLKPNQNHATIVAGIRKAGDIATVMRVLDSEEFHQLVLIESPTIRRELLLAMRSTPPTSPVYRDGFNVWLGEIILWLAKKYDGKDIFYLAAINIACGTDPQRRDKVLDDFTLELPEWNDKVADLVWELRPKSVLPRLEKLLTDNALTPAQRGRVVDILAVNDELSAGKSLLNLLTTDAPDEVKQRALTNLSLFIPTKWKGLQNSPELKTAIDSLLQDEKLETTGLQLVGAAQYMPAVERVATILHNRDNAPERRKAALSTLSQLQTLDSVKPLAEVLNRKDDPLAADAAYALSEIIGLYNDKSDAGQAALIKLRQALRKSDTPLTVRQAVVNALAGSRGGTDWLLEQKEQNKLPNALLSETGRLLRNSPFQGQRNKALLLFPAPAMLDPTKLPSIQVLAERRGDAERGRQLFLKSLTGETQCMKCHTVNDAGGKIGPDLSAIGIKGSRENLFESILQPSKAVADLYVTWTVTTIDGLTISGLLVAEDEKTLTIRDANGKDYPIPVADIDARSKSLVSLMPESLVAKLTEGELIDLVEYLTTLKKEEKKE